jgi:cytochrome c oxidase subunit 3/cytochrome o ubiquinol oxidase subunit 3
MSASVAADPGAHTWRGRVGMICLIVTEASLFSVFVVAHLFYTGKSLSGPLPSQVLVAPVLGTICLLSSSLTVGLGARALHRSDPRRCGTWLLVTLLLGAAFLAGTVREWYALIVHNGLTIATNLFGTTFYPLVGLHASHVIVGLVMLALCTVFAWSAALTPVHSGRVEMVAWYWHFVDGVWVVVFTVVYVVGR